MSFLFSPEDACDLYARQLPQPTVTATLKDLEGVILFGAGRYTRALMPALKQKGITPAWIVDNDEQRWGTYQDGIPIRSATSLKESGERTVLIMTDYLKEMAETCVRSGVRHWSWFTDISEVFGNVAITVSADTVLHNPEIDRLCTILKHSPESIETLKAALRCRVTGDHNDAPPCMPGWYFPDDLLPQNIYRNFIDCGAFDGDTLKEWIEKRSEFFPPEEIRYHAFEPDPDNFSAMEKYGLSLPECLRERIILHRAAVGDVAGTMFLVQGGDGTAVYEKLQDGVETPVVRLDDALADQPVLVIKMDVEGFELRALEGAKALLNAQQPALMISIYHRPEHLWKIPLWIHDLGLGYRIILRHHSTTSSETLCYAIPERLTGEEASCA